MLKTSNIKSMAQILRDMKNPPVKEDTDKDEPGTQGDKEEYQKKRKEIANKFGVESCSALKDEEKRKACYAALDAAHVSDDEEEDEDDDPVGKNEEVEIDEKFAGWIAMYGGKKLEIKKSEADGIWPAKQLAIKHFKVPKSKQGLLAIKPAHEEVEIDEKATAFPATVDTLKKIVKDKQHQTVMFTKGSAKVDLFTASAMVAVYNALKQPKLKKKFEDMIKSKEGFIQTQAFAMKMAKEEVDLEALFKEEVEIEEGTALDESLALQLKMAFSDAKIKMKSRGGKIVIAKRDKKKAMDTLTKVLPSRLKKYVDKAVGNFLVFEEVETEASTYRDKKYAKKKTGKVPPSQKASRWGQGGYGKEEVEEKRSATGYDLYHKDFSSAMQHAYAHAKKKGFIVDPKEIDDKVATGPKKPSSGKTNRYILGTNKKKKVHIQVANLDNKRYELNMYIESTINHSALDKVRGMIKEKYVTQDKFFPKVLMDGLKKAIPGVKMARFSIKHPRSGQNIPGLGLQLSGDKGIRVMIQYDREDAPAPKGMPDKIVDIDPETGKKEVTDTSFRDSYAVWVNDVGKIWKPNEARWIQTKDFRDPKKVVQFLKTKVKRMAKEEVEIDEAKGPRDNAELMALGNKLRNEKDKKKKQELIKKIESLKDVTKVIRMKILRDFGEEVEIQEHCGECEMGITEEVSAKEFDALKKGDTVTIEFKSPMSTGKSTFKVTAKNVVGKARIEKVTLKNVKRPNTVKFFLYKRGNKVSLAQGDMAASVVSFTKEGIDIEKASMGAVIKDFQNSDAPQFKGKSDKKRREMAIAAKLSKEQKEEDEPKSNKKDKINLKPKMDEKQMKKLKELQAGLREKRAQQGTLKKTVSDYHKEEVVKEAVLDNGLEVGEQEFDIEMRKENLYPNLDVNFAKYMDEGLEGPYEVSGEVYFYDRKVQMFYSVSGEDYVDEETAKEIAYRLHKDGFYKPELGR